MNTTGFMHSLDTNKPKTIPLVGSILIFIVFVVGGGVGGYFLAHKSNSSITNSGANGAKVQTSTSAGVSDKKNFKDSSEGILRVGGMDGEGSFHLERLGGESQTAYLTSSTVDLSKYVGKKVKVWGQTYQSQKAGWLMDVGLVEIQ